MILEKVACLSSAETLPFPCKKMSLIDDDDDIQLSSDTLLILQQFLDEQKARHELESTKIAQQESDNGTFNVFEENWVKLNYIALQRLPNRTCALSLQQLSQFWYDQSTKDALSTACRRMLLKSDTAQPAPKRIALLSCPSLYEDMKKTNADATVILFEYDQRFAVYKQDFVHYDYNLADNDDYLHDHNESFDAIIADPPFLAEECIAKISRLIKRIARSPETKIILCSGEKVRDWANEYLQLHECNFKPKHTRNLANEFTSFANFNLDEFIA